MQGNQRYVIFAYLGAGFLLAMTLARLLGALAFVADIPNPAVIGSQLPLSGVLGALLAIGAGFYAYRHPAARAFSEEVVVELRKVTWPSRKDTQSATVVVIVTTLILAAILGLFDLVWAKLTGIIYVS